MGVTIQPVNERQVHRDRAWHTTLAPLLASVCTAYFSHGAVLEDTPSNRQSLGLPEPA
jgi:hypothetical protein